MATQEFTAKNHIGQDVRYTPKAVTYNGQKGHIWARHTFIDNCWVFSGQSFHDLKATRKEIAG